MVVKFKGPDQIQEQIEEISKKLDDISVTVKSQTKLESEVEEYLFIQAKLEELEVPAMLAKQEAIAKTLRAIANDSPPDEEVVFEADNGLISFSKGRNETTIMDKAGIIKAIGQKVFNAIAKITLTDLKKYLSESELQPFIEVKPGSSRTMKATLKK